MHLNIIHVYLLELYQQMLAKALAHYFEAKLLLLDVTDFSLKVSLYLEITFLCSQQELNLLIIIVLNP